MGRSRCIVVAAEGAYERAGRYGVVVEKAGFKRWTERQLRVERDECHVLPVRVEARLERR